MTRQPREVERGIGERADTAQRCFAMRPALLSPRIRAVFGMGARSELLRAFLLRPDSAMTDRILAAETSCRKRSVLNELEPLRFAGLVQSFRAVNVDRSSLAEA